MKGREEAVKSGGDRVSGGEPLTFELVSPSPKRKKFAELYGTIVIVLIINIWCTVLDNNVFVTDNNRQMLQTTHRFLQAVRERCNESTIIYEVHNLELTSTVSTPKMETKNLKKQQNIFF